MDARYLGNSTQLSSVRRVKCTDGKSSGLKIIELDNGVVSLDILESKALDIGSARYKGKNVSFISKNGYDNVSGNFGTAFNGGLLYSCGLENVGAREGFPTHGSLHNIPAEVTRAEVDANGNIVVEGNMRVTELFGQNLTVHRKIRLPIGESRILIEDTITNNGYKPADYSMLYHVNFGYPFLTENTTLALDGESVRGRTPYAEARKARCLTMRKPEDDAEECVYFHKLKAPHAEVISPDFGCKAILDYSGEALPCFIEWQSMVSGDYALGLEPSTTFLDGEFRYEKLKEGASVTHTIKIMFEDL